MTLGEGGEEKHGVLQTHCFFLLNGDFPGSGLHEATFVSISYNVRLKMHQIQNCDKNVSKIRQEKDLGQSYHTGRKIQQTSRP